MIEQNYEYSTDVSANGNWQLDIPGQLDEGLHTIIVTDEYGNEDTALLFVQSDRDHSINESEAVSVADKNVSIIGSEPSFLVYGILFLLVVGLSAIIYFANKIRLYKSKNKKIFKRFSKIIIIFSVALLVLLAMYSIFTFGKREWINQTNRLDQEYNKETVTVLFSGELRDPLSFESVAGVNLSAGEVNVLTQEGGQFIFSNLDRDKGIRINHPKLKKSLVYTPKDLEKSIILFDVDLFNGVIEIVDAMSRTNHSNVYSHLEPELRSVVSEDDIFKTIESIFSKDNITDQSLQFYSAEKIEDYSSSLIDKNYKNVVVIKLSNIDKTEILRFIKKEDNWWLIK